MRGGDGNDEGRGATGKGRLLWGNGEWETGRGGQGGG